MPARLSRSAVTLRKSASRRRKANSLMKVNVIGAGLAGSEAAFFLASHGQEVNLYDQQPVLGPAFHEKDKFGELVCSNSLKSVEKDNACGLLKAEIASIGSLVMEAATKTRLPSGQDLA